MHAYVRLICCAGPIAFRQAKIKKKIKTRKHFVLFKIIQLHLNWLHTAQSFLSYYKLP